MGIVSLNRLLWLRSRLIGLRRRWLTLRYGVDIDPSSAISLSSRLLGAGAGSISVGAETLIAFKTLVYCQDPASGKIAPVRIGGRCFVGGGATILPGVTVHDESIIAAGSVVFDDVPPRSIVAGNPARVIRSEIEVGPYGRLKGADENTRRMWTA